MTGTECPHCAGSGIQPTDVCHGEKGARWEQCDECEGRGVVCPSVEEEQEEAA